MTNKVGDNIPQARAIAQLLEQLREVIAKLRAFGITLDASDRRRLLHARTGAEPHVRRVYELAEKHNVKVRGIPLVGMLSDLNLSNTMKPFVDEFRAGLALAEDTEGQAESETWEAFLAYYGVLSGMADHDPEIAQELASVVAFMANGPRKRPANPA